MLFEAQKGELFLSKVKKNVFFMRKESRASTVHFSAHFWPDIWQINVRHVINFGRLTQALAELIQSHNQIHRLFLIVPAPNDKHSAWKRHSN